MKDPMMVTNKELVGEISALKKKITGNADTFSWETAYKGLGQSQSEQTQVEKLLRESEDKYRRLAEEMAIITEIGRVIGSSLDIGEVYERFAAEARKLIPFDRIVINLIDHEHQMVKIAHISGMDIPGRRVGDSFPLKETANEHIAQTHIGSIVQPQSAEEGVRCYPFLSIGLSAGLNSLLSVPLISRDEMIGVLHFRSKKPNAYAEGDLRLADRIGAQIAGAIAKAQLFTDLKKTEKSLRESEGRLRTLVEQAAVGVAEIEMSTGRFLTVNQRLCEMLDRTEEEMLAASFQEIMHPEDLHQHEEKTALLLAGEIGHYGLEERCLRKDGEIIWANITASLLWKSEETTGRNIVTLEDITERKRIEAVLQQAHDEQEQRAADRSAELMRVNEELRAEITERKLAEVAIVAAKNDWENTFDSITDIITIHDEDFNIVQANPAAKAILELQMQEEMSLVKYLKGYHGTGKPPVGCLSQGCQTEMPCTVEVFEPYLNKHLEIRAMPRLGSDGRLVGSIHVVRDITERKKAEEQLQNILDSFKKTISTTIQAMGSAVETRDPYTAGHQIRSAALALKIASKMGLSQDKIDAIRLASSIHDIGKLSIPAEILSNPAKLSEIEFPLIREHVKRGYEILKDVESSWPLAEIVYQHHERMDGSGYPRNLKGEEICMEARIIAVADVVEAMASHRPYRSDLGIDAALNEIEKNRGIFYDDAVVDACLRLFREEGFRLAGT
jgi:PAS domain S-box-containing protein